MGKFKILFTSGRRALSMVSCDCWSHCSTIGSKNELFKFKCISLSSDMQKTLKKPRILLLFAIFASVIRYGIGSHRINPCALLIVSTISLDATLFSQLGEWIFLIALSVYT